MTTEPTDAELKAMWQIHAADIGGIFHYARAVLAKWGQPVVACSCHMAFSSASVGVGLSVIGLLLAVPPASQPCDHVLPAPSLSAHRLHWCSACGVVGCCGAC